MDRQKDGQRAISKANGQDRQEADLRCRATDALFCDVTGLQDRAFFPGKAGSSVVSVLGDHKVRKRFKKHHDVKVRVVLAGFGAHGLYDRRDKGGRVLGKEVPHFLGFIFQKKDNRETEHRGCV